MYDSRCPGERTAGDHRRWLPVGARAIPGAMTLSDRVGDRAPSPEAVRRLAG